jgi:phage tail sheath gpL-like
VADPVAFDNTPSDIRTPLFTAELNAGTPPYSGVSRSLLIGRMLSATGSATPGVPINIGGGDPNQLFGPGSMLAEMAVYARAHNPIGVIYALPIPDGDLTSPGSATGSIAFSGTATAAGTFTRYIGGHAYSCGVAIGDVAATVAANFLAAVQAGYTMFGRRMLPCVTAALASATITFTARHPGPEGNMIRIEAGIVGNEVDPAGIAATITAMSGGTATVTLATELSRLGSQPFDWIAGPYNTGQNLIDAQNFLADSGTGRWSPTVGLGGHYLTANDGNLSAQTTLGAAHNDKHTTTVGINQYPEALWAWLAGIVGIVGQSKNLGAPLSQAIEVARPLQTLQLQNLHAPANRDNEWALSDRQSLYSSGIAALTFGADGTPQIDRMVTMYQTNPYGVADSTFLDLETLAISRYVIDYMKAKVTATYPRCVLLDANPGGLQGVATPTQIQATIVHAYNDLYGAGLVDDPATFAQYLIVARSTDPSRVDAYLPTGVASQLRVLATNVTIYQELAENIGT